MSRVPGGQQVESAVGEPATSHSPGTREDPARSGRAAPDTRSAGPRRMYTGLRSAPHRSPPGRRPGARDPGLPGAAPGTSGAPGPERQPRPPGTQRPTAPRRAPRALTQRQERQQQRPRRRAPHARPAGATLRLLLLPRRRSSSSSSSSGCSRVGCSAGPRACSALPAGRTSPAPARTCAPGSSRPSASSSSPALHQPPGPGASLADPRAQQPGPPPESKREEPWRPPARASHPALCQQQTQTFPSPSPLQVTEEAPGHPLKGEEMPEPTQPSPRAPTPRETFLRPLKVGLEDLSGNLIFWALSRDARHSFAVESPRVSCSQQPTRTPSGLQLSMPPATCLALAKNNYTDRIERASKEANSHPLMVQRPDVHGRVGQGLKAKHQIQQGSNPLPCSWVGLPPPGPPPFSPGSLWY